VLHLTPKPGGGRRPIGLVDGTCRLWELARKELVTRWRASLQRPYDFSRKGKASAEAVWIQALGDEDAEASGEASATLLMDLTKAFESVPLHEVWRRGVLLKFPLKILRLGLELCSAPRHLTYGGAVMAKGVASLSAILAGLTFATDYMFIALAPEIDRWVYRYPCLKVAAVVDDVSIQMSGPAEEVSELMLTVSAEAMGDLRKLGCIVSAGPRWRPGGKTVVTASCSRVAGVIRNTLKANGVALLSTVRHVGLDYAAGKLRQPKPVRRARIRGACRKAAK
jgi:hypothetical protein